VWIYVIQIKLYVHEYIIINYGYLKHTKEINKNTFLHIWNILVF
jgi:hypothetical protein